MGFGVQPLVEVVRCCDNVGVQVVQVAWFCSNRLFASFRGIFFVTGILVGYCLWAKIVLGLKVPSLIPVGVLRA